MDKYIVRTKREFIPQKKHQAEEKDLVQATIFDLKRVVVVEDFQRAKVLLEIEEQSTDVILDQLAKIKDKIPSKEVLEETGLGLILNKLRKHHHDSEVKDLAKDIYSSWKNHFKRKQDLPQIEVRHDNTTTKLRQSGRKLLKDVLQSSKEAEVLAEAIERTVYERNGRTNELYRRQIRGLVFILRNQHHILEQLLSKKMTVTDLCDMKSHSKAKQSTS